MGHRVCVVVKIRYESFSQDDLDRIFRISKIGEHQLMCYARRRRGGAGVALDDAAFARGERGEGARRREGRKEVRVRPPQLTNQCL